MASVTDFSYVGTPGEHAGMVFDKLLELVAPGTALTTATGTTPINIGTGLVDANLVLDVTTATGTVSIAVEYADNEGFTEGLTAGISQAIKANYKGRIVLPFRNAWANEKPKLYMRLKPTIASGGALELSAFVTKR